jgi:hypothetical protein
VEIARQQLRTPSTQREQVEKSLGWMRVPAVTGVHDGPAEVPGRDRRRARAVVPDHEVAKAERVEVADGVDERLALDH